jgi:hypothetical protein
VSDLVPVDLSPQQLDALIVQQIQGNNLALQALRSHQQRLDELALAKADRREMRALEAEVADLQAELQRVSHSRDHLTVVALESLLKIRFDRRDKVGAELTALSRELCIAKLDRPDDRFGAVGAYHPYVCREYCERNQYPLPPLLKYAADPR